MLARTPTATSVRFLLPAYFQLPCHKTNVLIIYNLIKYHSFCCRHSMQRGRVWRWHVCRCPLPLGQLPATAATHQQWLLWETPGVSWIGHLLLKATVRRFYYSVLNIVVVFILQPYLFQENNHNGRHTRTEISIDGFYIVKYVMKLSFMTAQYGTVQRLSCHFDYRCHNIGIFKFVMSTIYKMQILLVHLFPFRCLSSCEQIYLLWRNRKLCHIEISTCLDTISDWV